MKTFVHLKFVHNAKRKSEDTPLPKGNEDDLPIERIMVLSALSEDTPLPKGNEDINQGIFTPRIKKSEDTPLPKGNEDRRLAV